VRYRKNPVRTARVAPCMGASRDFLISPTALEARTPTDLHAKWLKRRGFTQECEFGVKIATFHTP